MFFNVKKYKPAAASDRQLVPSAQGGSCRPDCHARPAVGAGRLAKSAGALRGAATQGGASLALKTFGFRCVFGVVLKKVFDW